MSGNVVVCPKCQCQLTLSVAAGAKSQVEATIGIDINVGEVAQYLQRINVDSLNEWEAGFIRDVKDRYDKYGKNIRLTDKQVQKIKTIADGSF